MPTTVRPAPPTDPRPGRLLDLRSREVNLLLAALVTVALVTGFVSWGIGTGWARWSTVAHGVAGLTLLVLAPLKLRTSVRRGFRRGRATRWVSALFGVLVVTTVALGVAHATGLWFGVGQWSALWTHVLAAVLVVPLLLWHVTDRPQRPRRADLNRRVLLSTGVAVAVAGAAYAAQEGAVRAAGLAGGRRRSTGSHEVGSFDPAAMPTVSWLDDETPADTDPASWPLSVFGRPTTVASLADVARTVEATVDCTGGWFSRQRWDCVALADLLPADADRRSIRVTSATGYARLLPRSDAEHLYLAVGYDGTPLRRGHGAPVRLVAPGRRGPWWVKWVTDVSLTDRPTWLQLPFPPT